MIRRDVAATPCAAPSAPADPPPATLSASAYVDAAKPFLLALLDLDPVQVPAAWALGLLLAEPGGEPSAGLQ